MKKVAPSRRMRAVVFVAILLVLQVAPVARAGAQAPAQQTSAHDLPLPSPGTDRLIRVGPQALILEDDQGRFAMVDEVTSTPRRSRGLVAVTALVGILGAGAFVAIEAPTGLTLDVGSRNVPR